MRVLFTFAGGNGHFAPLLPIARTAAAAGHNIAVACQPAMIPTVEAAGFVAFATGGATLSNKRQPLLRLDTEREYRAVREGYASRIARDRAVCLLSLCNQWQPDILVCDEMDFGAMVIAERLGIPYATVLVIAAGSFVRRELITEPLNVLRAEHALPPDPKLTMLSRYLVLAPFPPSHRDPAFPLPPTAHSFRPSTLDRASNHTALPWIADLPKVPTIYFTLGTVFNLESGDLFVRVLAGLRDLSFNVVVTVGSGIDPRELGPQADNVRVETYIDQSLLLPHCNLVVCHAGSGSVMGALAHGLPMVLLPIGADQPFNAARCEQLGVARVLDAVETTPDTVREAVSGVMADATYRLAAERIRDEIRMLPGPEHAMRLLERLAAEKQPILAT